MSKSTLNLEQNVASFLCYLFGWISGLVILLIEKENKTVRFHAAQSLVVFGALSVLRSIFAYSFMFGLGLFQLLHLAAIGLWIFLMVKAWKDEMVRLPVAAEFADTVEEKVKI